ncbi:MAG: DUF5615 family PIN-like protein [Anaerolineae bacterium]|jgi:hypothetical protein|nr:DUF5615 family PIN-like protein [Anaerolineae bacterium]
MPKDDSCQEIQLYLDEDAQRASIIRALRARQVDVITAAEAGLLGCSDEAQLVYASEQQRTIFTFNRGDFVQLHSAWLVAERHHAGIVVSDQLETGVIVRRLLKLLAAHSAHEMCDRLEYLSTWR